MNWLMDVVGVWQELVEKEIERFDNPFTISEAVDPPNFIGRQEIIKAINDVLSGHSPKPNCRILGPPKIGKTSLLKFLTHKKESSDIFVYVNVLGKRSHTQLINAIYDEVKKHSPLSRLIPLRAKDDALKGLLRSSKERNRRVILCLDDFDQVFDAEYEDYDKAFFDFLASLANDREVSFILSLKRDLEDLSNWSRFQKSDFWALFSTPVPLGLMLDGDVERLLLRGKPLFDKEDRNFIRKLAGNHPRFIQIVCNWLFDWKKMHSSPTADEAQEAKARISTELASWFSDYLDDLGKDYDQRIEKALQSLSQKETSYDTRKDSLAILKQVALVTPDGRFFSEAFSDFVSSRAKDVKSVTATGETKLIVDLDKRSVKYGKNESGNMRRSTPFDAFSFLILRSLETKERCARMLNKEIVSHVNRESKELKSRDKNDARVYRGHMKELIVDKLGFPETKFESIYEGTSKKGEGKYGVAVDADTITVIYEKEIDLATFLRERILKLPQVLKESRNGLEGFIEFIGGKAVSDFQAVMKGIETLRGMYTEIDIPIRVKTLVSLYFAKLYDEGKTELVENRRKAQEELQRVFPVLLWQDGEKKLFDLLKRKLS